MNTIRKTLSTLRNHWKKSVFFSVVGVYGSSVIIERIKVNKLMRVYCQEALKFGDEKIHPILPTRHVTVILNPVAKKRSAKATYEKYVAPILHCAGLKVSLIQTEQEGQGKELMEIMVNTDAVVIAGGSGTIHEAITGLLRRQDGKSFPLGFVPLGKLNRSYFSSFWSLNGFPPKNGLLEQVKQLADATMAVVKENIKNIDVLKVESFDRNKAVYAVDSFFLGTTKDILSICDAYWYLGNSMKPYLALGSKSIFRKLEDLKMHEDLCIKYTDPCSGCNTCRAPKDSNEQESNEKKVTQQTRRWWSSFFTSKPIAPVDNSNKQPNQIDYSTISNPSCGLWREVDLKHPLLDVVVENEPNNQKSRLILHTTENASQGSFIVNGVDARKGLFCPSPVTFDFKDIEIKIRQDSNEVMQKKKRNDRMFSIDGEDYEFGSLRITRIPQRITIYAVS